MSNINQTQNLFALDTVQDLDDETAATCTGGADVILYKDLNGKGDSLHITGKIGQGISNVGPNFNDQTSSITIKQGVWEFYQDSYYNNLEDQYGADIKRGPGNYNLGANNDKITSLKRVGA